MLFRAEAVEHVTRRLAGDVILASSLSSRLLTGLLVLVVCAGLVFASLASYARKETVVGWLSPPNGLIRLTARQGGVAEQIHVAEGDTVVVGQPIATLSLSSELTGGDSFNTLRTSLAVQAEAADARLAAARASLNSEQRQLLSRRSALERELGETRRRAALQRDRIAMARVELGRAESIAAQGYMPRAELETRRSSVLVLEQQASEVAGGVLAFEREIGEVDARLAAIPIDLRGLEAEASSARAGLDQQMTQTEAQASYVVIATVAGRVAALPVQQGQSAPPGAVLAVISADAGELEAELYAPSRAIGFIRPGQEVKLMYQAFPHQKFGTGEGRVRSVSSTVLAPDEVAIPGVQLQEPVFRIRANIPHRTVQAYGREEPLRPGMLVTADVVIDRRSLLEWLLDPLYAVGRR
jgi:membrane fusion protein